MMIKELNYLWADRNSTELSILVFLIILLNAVLVGFYFLHPKVSMMIFYVIGIINACSAVSYQVTSTNNKDFLKVFTGSFLFGALLAPVFGFIWTILISHELMNQRNDSA